MDIDKLATTTCIVNARWLNIRSFSAFYYLVTAESNTLTKTR